MKTRKSGNNLIAAIGSQLIILALGLVIPRLTLVNYGSETNGFISLVGQMYAYIALLEAGLGTAALQALYKPIAEQDHRGVSEVVNTAEAYYRKLTISYGLIVVVLSLLLPLCIKCELQYWEMAAYFFLYGFSHIINFWFIAAKKPLLNADGRSYISSNVTLIFHIATQAAKIVLLNLGVSLVVIQVSYTAINLFQLLVYHFYFRSKYYWIDKTVPVNKNILKQRGAFFVQQIGHLIFSCTDVLLISMFCDLKAASIYAVYNLIFNSLSTLIAHANSSCQFILGQAYHRDKEKYPKTYRIYEAVLLIAAFTLYSTAYFLTIPFIKLYTQGVSDANYLDTMLPILFALNGLVATCKSMPLTLINISGKVRESIMPTITEVIINLVMSVILIPVLGVAGALIGTLCASVYRVIQLAYYANRKILSISVWNSVRVYATNFLVFGLLVIMNSQISLDVVSYWEFALHGCIMVIILVVVYGIMAILNERQLLMFLLKGFTRK